MPTVTDADGNVYNTVQIGSQCWMKENLKVGTMIDGSIDMTDNGVIEKYCYNNDPNLCITYGGLYQWSEMMQYNNQHEGQGICPNGWHIPSDANFALLEEYLYNSGLLDGFALQETGTAHWEAPNEYATNSTGFTALGSGKNFDLGSYKEFRDLKQFAYYWSSSSSGNEAGGAIISEGIGGSWTIKTHGFSVRCIKD